MKRKKFKKQKKRKEYIPTCLRDKELGKSQYDTWYIGMLDFKGVYVLLKGIFHTEMAALEMTGKKNYIIIHSDPDGVKSPIWRWEFRRWLKITKDEKKKFSEVPEETHNSD